MKRPLFTVCLCVILLLGSLNLFGVFDHREKTFPFPDKTKLTVYGTVISRSKDSFILKAIEVSDSQSSYTPGTFSNKKIKVSSEGISEKPKIGEALNVTGTYRLFSHAANPGEFDFADYNAEQGIAGSLKGAEVLSTGDGGRWTFSENTSKQKIYIENVHLPPSPVDKTNHKKAPVDRIREGLMCFRERCEERLYHIFPADEASVLSDMVLGNKQDISPEIKELYRKNGISHILSISSLHISILGLGLYMALRKTGAKLWICGGITGLFLLAYAVMTGMSISAMRAVIMFLIKLLADAVGRTVDNLTSLSLTALILLIPNPAAIGSCSFLLSFGSVAGIICLYPVIKKPFEEIFRKKPVKRWQKLLLGVLGSVLMSLSISLTTLPITLWFFYEIPTYSIFLNIIILPFMSLLIVSTIFAMLIPGGGFIGTIGYLILKFYEGVCRVCNYLPLYTWNPGRPKVWMVVLYYAVWLIIVLSPVAIEYLICLSKHKKKADHDSKHLLTVRLLPASLILLLPLVLSFPKMSRNTLTVLDVGQGDGMIYYTDNRDVYLIDGGSSSKEGLGEYILKPALKYYGFSTVDAVFISHSDTDHLSGIAELLENGRDWGINIKQVVLPKCKTPADFGIKNANISYISAGDTWKSGDNRFTCLHPDDSFKADDTNEMSECIYLKFFESKNDSPVLLLTGDVQGAGEKALAKKITELNASSDSPVISILKVAHHGSKHSTLDSFLKAYNPSIALISAGKKNHYGHPHKETLSRLETAGAQIYNTQKNGAITITVTPHKMIINTYNYFTSTGSYFAKLWIQSALK